MNENKEQVDFFKNSADAKSTDSLMDVDPFIQIDSPGIHDEWGTDMDEMFPEAKDSDEVSAEKGHTK